MTLLLSNEDVLQLIEPLRCIEALELAFADLARGEAVNRPRSHTYTPLGDGHWYVMKTMDGSLPRYGVHALRLGSNRTHEFLQDGVRRREKLPLAPGHRFVGLVVLFDISTLEPLAIMQDGELQRWQVGCTSALAAKHLARGGPASVGLIGSGWQAETQLLALAKVRILREIRAYSKDPERLGAFCERLSQLLGQAVRPAGSPQEAIDGVDIVALATNARDPVIDGAWLRPGQHLNSISPQEFGATTLERATIIVVRNKQPAACLYPPGQAPWEAEEATPLDDALERKLVELGEVVCGRAGRSADEDVTVFAPAGGTSGLGVTFAAVGHVVYQAAKARGIGRELPTEWFTETAKP